MCGGDGGDGGDDGADVHKCVYRATYDLYEDIFVRDNSLRYFHMKFRRDLLSSIIREILCAVNTKETMKMTKKWTMHF